jgi:hypothetical protein
MLKPNAPEKQVSSASEDWRKLGVIACFACLAVTYVLYYFRNGAIPEPSLKFYLFLFPTIVVANFVAMLFWWPIAAWASRVDLLTTMEALQNPNANRAAVGRFLEGWTNNEIALDALAILSRVVVFTGIYVVFGPILGIL